MARKARRAGRAVALTASAAVLGALLGGAAPAAADDPDRPAVERYRGSADDQIERASVPRATTPGSTDEIVLAPPDAAFG